MSFAARFIEKGNYLSDVTRLLFEGEFVSGEIAAHVHLEDQDPPAMDNVWFLQEVFRSLLSFRNSAADMQIENAYVLVSILGEIYEAAKAHANSPDSAATVRRLSEVWVKCSKPKPVVVPPSMPILRYLKELEERVVLKPNVEKKINDFVSGLLEGGETVDSAAFKECQILQGLLPDKVAQILKTARVLKTMQEASDQIEDGKYTGGLMGVNTLLTTIHSGLEEFPNMARRPRWEEKLGIIRGEWEKHYMKHVRRCASLETTVGEWVKKYEGGIEAIRQWELAKEPWLLKPATAEEEASMKAVSVLVVQWPLMKGLTAGLKATSRLMTKPNADMLEKMQANVQQLNDIVSKAITLLSEGMIASVLQNQAEAKGFRATLEAAINHCAETWKYTEKMFSPKLMEKITAARKGEPSAPGGAAGSGAGPADQAPQQQPRGVGQPPAKRLRRPTLAKTE